LQRVYRSIAPTIRVSILGLLLYALGAAAAASGTLLPPNGGAHDRTASATAAAQLLQTGTMLLAPKDTWLNTNKKNYSAATTLATYTWPDYQAANAILMKFDLSTLPAGAVVTEAILQLALVNSDTATDTYTVTAHKVLGKNPNIAKATGYTADGVIAWTPDCCLSGAPLAQSDISPAYDSPAINRVRGYKAWTITTMVQEWQLNPATNFGLLLNSDAFKPRDRYRRFASMEHADASVRPFLKVSFVAADVTPPSVAITAPSAGEVSGSTALSASASDNVAVASVQFQLNGAPLGAAQAAPPYSLNWDTANLSDGAYSLTAVARDTSGNATTSAAIAVTVNNGTLLLSPDDTWLNVNANNYSTDTILPTYTWPDYQIANAILMKFDLSSVPPSAVVQEAKLFLALVQSDTFPAETYNVAASKVLGHNPVIGLATGYTVDGVTNWTPSACCQNGVPLAQSDISPPYATEAVNKIPGYKSWTITAMFQEWLDDPSGNRGLLINSDASKARDHFRIFASKEHPDTSLRPFLRVVYSEGASDTTPPAIGTVLVSGVTASNATIEWTTDEASSTQVEYGLTSAYGQVSPLGGTLGTAHGVTLTGLDDLTQYHFRVRSRDAAGNLATSGNFTFVTRDGTAPTVSVAAPAAGATVSGTITVSANANDNLAVAGVQFKLDGVNAGAEDTTAPFSMSWNTATVPDGSHTLTAAAHDAAGNLTNSAAIIVNVSNTPPPPPPPSAGIASGYPGDAGIENDPNVVFVERFNESTLSNLFGRWTDVLNGSAMSFSSDVPAGSPVARSLNIPWVGGGVNNGGHLFKQLSPGVDDTLYVRYYIKYPASGRPQHEGIWLGGANPPLSYPNPQAGIRPNGNDRFSAAPEQSDDLSRFDHYNYWMGMRQAGDGNYWGNTLLNNANVTATPGQWMCVEHMVKLNAPVTAVNGEHAIWINGVKVSHLGQGFPKGFWSGGNFTQDPNGTAFEGFRWRSDANLKLNWIWLQNYAPNDPAGLSSSIKYAHVVAAKSYIGCLTAGVADTTLPSTSLTAPATGASLSGVTNVAANASDNVAVAGVQFKLNGANLGAEDTSSPYSISWDTTAATNGTHTLTTVARDTAGNQVTSAPLNVSVNNTSGGGTAVFTSNWDTAAGTSSAAVSDGGRWPNYWEFNGGSSVQLLSVVAGGPNGHNALRVQQRGSSFAANLQIDNVLPQSRDFYLRYYMKNDDTSSAGDHIVTADTYNYANLTYMRKTGGASNWNFVISMYGCGYTYPIGHWGPAVPLANGQWYRLEYYVHYVDATHVQVHPRVYDANGNLILADAQFRQSDFGGASWNGRSDWTLESYYAAGHSFCVNPAWLNDFGLGNNGQFGAADTGQYWYFAGVEIRTDRWPGAVQ
jgi:hypothetical protein